MRKIAVARSLFSRRPTYLIHRVSNTASNRQVFGLEGSILLIAASQLVANQCLNATFVPFTAAGQSRILTGFPFQTRRPRRRVTNCLEEYSIGRADQSR